MGLQYAWIFTYPESGVTSGELHIPVNSDIKLTIKAQDVLHAFWLPEFRLKQDAIPGQPAELRFQPRLEGEYPIVCAELCGPYHGAMGAKLYVESQEAFDQWLQSQVVAQKEGDQTVASLTDRTDAARLAPVAAELGVTAETLKSLQPAA
jgi:cytochrome c oxidase subunit 2